MLLLMPKENLPKHLTTRLYGRVIAEEVKLSNKSENYPAGTLVDEEVMKVLANDPKVESVNVLSPLTDDNEHGSFTSFLRNVICYR